MFNSSSHLIGDMARMQHEDLIRYAAEQRLHRLGTPDSNARWTKARTIFGDWLITAGQQLKPATQPVIGHQAP